MREESLELISNLVRQKVNDHFKLFLKKEIAQQIASWFLFREKHKLTNDDDPPWDQSGSTYVDEDDSDYQVSDYKTVGDFLSEYTGCSEPTFYSGRGLRHLTFEDEISTLISDYVSKCLDEALSGVDPKILFELIEEKYHEPFDKDALIQDFYEADIFQDRIEIEFEVLDKINALDFAQVFELGKYVVIKSYVRDNIEKQLREDERRVQSAKVDELWPKIQKEYEAQFGEPLVKIDKKHLQCFNELLESIGITKEERKLIAVFRRSFFSNRVYYLLAEGH